MLSYAARSAAAAQAHVALAESSDSGLDTKTRMSTVTRALRLVKGVKRKAKRPAGERKLACSSQSGSVAAPEMQNVQAAACREERASGNGRAPIESEEEKRARKRAKKLRQREDRAAKGGDDAERRAKLKARRERKKARLRQLKEAHP